MQKVKSLAFSYLTLLSSTSTLLCCALPALLVNLGLGAVMAGLAGSVPGLVWISENKTTVFVVAGVLLTLNGWWMWQRRNAPCPTDPKLREACTTANNWSQRLYIVSLVVFMIGGFFAFIAPLIF